MLTLLRLLRMLAVRLRPRLATRIGIGLGLFGYHVIRYRRSLIEGQLSRALGLPLSDPDLKRLARANFVHYGLLVVEFFRIRLLTTSPLESTVRLEGENHLRAALAEGKGVLILSAHLGAYDLSVVALALRGFPLMIVSKPSKAKGIERFWMEERSVPGLQISLSHDSVRGILRALREGMAVVFVLDQHASAEQVWVDFFGRPASTLPAPAVLTRRTGAPVVPVFTHRAPDGTHVIEIHPALVFEERGDRDWTTVHNTQRYTAVIEAAIRKRPEQWTWIHRRWKEPRLGACTVLASENGNLIEGGPKDIG